MRRAYCLNGYRFVSDCDLAGLPAWKGPEAAPADIVLRYGDVPSHLDGATHTAPVFQTRGNDEYLLALAGIGRILVRQGREIVAALDDGAEAAVATTLILGPILSVLWHQRGLLPLHASAVELAGRVLALCGASTAGKSTLAAHLVARGHKLLADDICLIDAPCDSEIMTLPGGPPLRLWRDALDALGIATAGLRQAMTGRPIFFLGDSGAINCTPRRLDSVVLLARSETGDVILERLHGVRTVGGLHPFVHMRRPARALGRARQTFTALTRLAASGIAIWRLQVPEGRTALSEAVAKLLAVGGEG